MIAINDFNAWYGGRHALRDVNLTIAEHAVTAIIGPSGCGKSTLLRSINRINDAIPGFRASGSVMMDGDNLLTLGEPATIALRRRVGMLFQRPNPFPMSIFDNVAYGPRLHGTRRAADLGEVVERSLQRVGLFDEVSDRLNTSALSLSGGQQQRLCLARTLAVDPQVILMDEPCSALDPIATAKIEELIRGLSTDVTIVIVTHNMQQAARVSTTTAFLTVDEQRTGLLVEARSTTDIFAAPRDQRTADYLAGRFG